MMCLYKERQGVQYAPACAYVSTSVPCKCATLQAQKGINVANNVALW